MGVSVPVNEKFDASTHIRCEPRDTYVIVGLLMFLSLLACLPSSPFLSFFRLGRHCLNLCFDRLQSEMRLLLRFLRTINSDPTTLNQRRHIQHHNHTRTRALEHNRKHHIITRVPCYRALPCGAYAFTRVAAPPSAESTHRPTSFPIFNQSPMPRDHQYRRDRSHM